MHSRRAIDQLIMEEEPMVPEWFSRSLATSPEVGTVVVDGTAVAYRAWGEPGPLGVVLIHGGAAHSRWWDHIAPLLTQRRRVVAFDLSGHGDSGRRPEYSLAGWAEELMAVSLACGIAGPPAVVGHSLGGFVAMAAALRYGAAIEGIATIDSMFRDLTPEESAAESGEFRRFRVHPTKAEAVSRWRPVPNQVNTLPYVCHYIAENSVHAVDGGWAWKFDPHVFRRVGDMIPPGLHRLDCRVALFRAEHGLMSATMSEDTYDKLGRLAATIEIPDAGHAVMLDQPLSLATAIRTLLADWEHSTPLVG